MTLKPRAISIFLGTKQRPTSLARLQLSTVGYKYNASRHVALLYSTVHIIQYSCRGRDSASVAGLRPACVNGCRHHRTEHRVNTPRAMLAWECVSMQARLSAGKGVSVRHAAATRCRLCCNTATPMLARPQAPCHLSARPHPCQHGVSTHLEPHAGHGVCVSSIWV